MKTRVLPLFALVNLLGSVALFAAPAGDVKLTRGDDRVRVELGGKLFTEYVFKGGPKPFLYPVLAADGTELMRHFPMRKDVADEAKDHPHHRSLWFTHGAVNGIDFWTEGANKGTIVNEAVEHSTAGGVGTIRARNRWVNPDGSVACTDETTIRVRAIPEGRLLDYEVTLKAPAGKPVVFGDTKEGSMAIRVPLWMTPEHTHQKKKVGGNGTMVNSQGDRNDAIWSKRATWVDYHAPKGGKVYGVALFDHPSNPRHPTWWHARSYGLFAANPFGKHDFEPAHKDNPKAGDLEIPAGGSVTFRWRFYFHMGDEKAGKVAEQYQAYAAGK